MIVHITHVYTFAMTQKGYRGLWFPIPSVPTRPETRLVTASSRCDSMLCRLARFSLSLYMARIKPAQPAVCPITAAAPTTTITTASTTIKIRGLVQCRQCHSLSPLTEADSASSLLLYVVGPFRSERGRFPLGFQCSACSLCRMTSGWVHGDVKAGV